MRFAVEPSASFIVARATSAVHDTEARCDAVRGWIEATPGAWDSLAAEVTASMGAFAAPDRLRTWKLRGILRPEERPTARFELQRAQVTVLEPNRRYEVAGHGVLSLGRASTPIDFEATVELEGQRLTAQATFAFDVRELDIEPPRMLGLSMNPVVRVGVTLVAVTSD